MRIVERRKAYVVPLLLCIFLSPLLAHPIWAESFSWAGTWDCYSAEFGTDLLRMTLTQLGGAVTGRTTYFNSTVEGSVSGNKLEGLFRTDKKYAQIDVVFSLEMSGDGNSFIGHIWNYGQQDEGRQEWNWFDGNRTSGSGINLLIVPVNLQDQAISNAKAYYDEIAVKLNSYFREVSYGQLSVNTRVFQNDSKWVTLPKTTAHYIGVVRDFLEDAIDRIDDEVDFTPYDYSDAGGKGVVAFISPAKLAGETSIIYCEARDGVFSTGDGTKIDAIYTFEDRFYGEEKMIRGLAHEFAHALGKILITSVKGTSKEGRWGLPDEYFMGNVECHYSLMGDVTIGGAWQKVERVHLDSFTKEWLGWLKYSDAQINMTYDIKRLDLMQHGDSVLRYQCKAGMMEESWYIFESRSALATWDSEIGLKTDSTFVAYRLERKPNAYAGYSLNRVCSYTFPGSLSDPNTGLLIRVSSFSEQGSKIAIEKFGASRLVGAVASPSAKVLADASAMVLPEIGFSVLPDVDLHAYDGDGKHVGMNYQTGTYENQIDGAIASGDLISGTEWIFAPDNANVRFVTSSSDTAEFFQEYPEASSYSNGLETYAMQMVYYGPDGSRYESEVTEQEISPGSTMEHGCVVTENADGSYSVTTSGAASPSTTPTPSSPPTDGTQQTYTVTFTQSGLPAGTTWSVTLGGQTKSSTGTAITFEVPNGLYDFTVSVPSGFEASLSQGSVTVDSEDISQTIAVTVASSPGGVSNLPVDPLIIVGIVLVMAIVVGVFLGLRSRKRQKRIPAGRQPIPPPPLQ